MEPTERQEPANLFATPTARGDGRAGSRHWKGTAVCKSYQNVVINTSQPTVLDTVSVSLAELACETREGLSGRLGPRWSAATDRSLCRPVCRRLHRHRAQDIETEHGGGGAECRKTPVCFGGAGCG